MGQATLDLPDPLEQPPETAAGTDDLLAQLAGEEIDRLLAEADEPKSAGAAAETPVAKAPATNDAKSQTTQESLLPVAAPAAVQEPPPEAQLGDFLGKLATERPQETPVAETKFQPAPVKENLSPKEAALNKLVAEADELEQDASLAAAERGALKEAETSALEEAIAAAPATSGHSGDSKAPFVLRLLAWINSPLDSLSDEARDLIGKVAILTMVNALSVLVYVLFFRHHG